MLVQRYILREHLLPFLLAISVIMFLLVVNLILELVDMIVGKGVPAPAGLEVFFLNLAWMGALTVPMAVLAGVLMAFGRLSADGEFAALKAGGIGLHHAAWPVLAAAVVVAGLMAWFNDRILPDANHRARMLMDDIRRKKPFIVLSDRAGLVITDFEDYRILIGGVDPVRQEVRDVLIYRNQAGEFPLVIAAARGEMALAHDGRDMILTLHHGEAHAVDARDQTRYIRTAFDRQVVVLGDAGRRLVRTADDVRGDREMTVAQMREQVDARLSDGAAAGRAAGGVFERIARSQLLGEGSPSPEILRDAERGLAEIRSDLMVQGHRERAANRFLVEIHKKYAIAAACIAFVFVGIPLGVAFRTGGAARSAAVSIGFFLVYWMFLIGGEKLADRGFLSPAVAMWAANALIGAGGAWLTWREIRR